MFETNRGVVAPSELDHMGHMNVQFYMARFGDATWHVFAALGMDNAYFRRENCGMAAVEQSIKYLAEAMAGDLLVCRSEVMEVTAKSVRFMHRLHNAATDEPIATCETTALHIDRAVRKTCPLPDFVAERAAALAGAS